MIDYLKEEIRNFSEGQFGPRTDPRGPLNHLKEEVIELIESIGKVDEMSIRLNRIPQEFEKLKKNEEEEWADCILLLLDSFRIRYGNETSYNKLLHFALNKLEVVKDREWDKEPDENGAYRHIKK